MDSVPLPDNGGNTLSPDTLETFLKDRTFVDYFNSFLLLPIFSCQLMYDTLTGHFIQLHLPQEDLLSSSTSLTVTDSDIYFNDQSQHMLDPLMLRQWIIEHRLPMFICSDLYAEYLLSNVLWKSSNQFIIKSFGANQPKLTSDYNSGDFRKVSSRKSSSRTRSLHDELVNCKPCMTKFKNYLQNKSGLKNWLYCIDLYQMKYCTSTDRERERLCAEMKSRYFINSSPLALSCDVTGCGLVTMATISLVGNVMLKGLTDYWFPCFLLHLLPSPLPSKGHTHSLPSLINHTPHPSAIDTPTFKRAKMRRPTNILRTYTTTPTKLSSHLISANNADSASLKRLKYNRCHIVSSGHNKVRPLSTGLINECSYEERKPQLLSVAGTPIDMVYNQQGNDKLLMKCLAIERRKCGGYFQSFLQSLSTKYCLHCLLFWREVQEYKMLFFSSDFNPLVVEMKSKSINSKYIMEYGTYSIDCPGGIQCNVLERLWPPYEDLFDRVEQYALGILNDKWIELCHKESESFQQIPTCTLTTCTTNRDIEMMDKLSEEYLSSVESSVCSLTTPTPQLSQESPAHFIATPTSHTPVVEREINLMEIMKNPTELEYFKAFLTDNNGHIDLMFWNDIEVYRSLPTTDTPLRNMRAKQLREKYFNKKYFFGPNCPVTNEVLKEIISYGGSSKLASRPKSPVFREAQKHVKSRLDKKWIPLYVKSEGYIERQRGGKEKGAYSDKNDTTLSSMEYSESSDTAQLKECLYNVKNREYFKEFMNITSPKGTRPSNNVDFWLEIQRYKSLFHYQMNPVLMKDKMKAIIKCYIQSPCQPQLQINIPVKVADELIKKSFGPYVFREAQNFIFRYLQTSWDEYRSFVSTVECPLADALQYYRERVYRERREEEQRIAAERKREEIIRQSTLHFETEAERMTRSDRREQVGVTFRLSSPSPYYQPRPPTATEPCPPIAKEPRPMSHTHVRFETPPTKRKSITRHCSRTTPTILIN